MTTDTNDTTDDDVEVTTDFVSQQSLSLPRRCHNRMTNDVTTSMQKSKPLTFAVNTLMQEITDLVMSTLAFVDVERQKSNNMNRSEQLHRTTSRTTRKKSKKHNVDCASQIKVSFVGLMQPVRKHVGFTPTFI